MYQFYKLKSALSGIINQGFPKAFSKMASFFKQKINGNQKPTEVHDAKSYEKWRVIQPLEKLQITSRHFTKNRKDKKKILQPYKIRIDNFYLKIRENIEIASEASYGYLKKKSVNIFFLNFRAKNKAKITEKIPEKKWK